MEGKIMNFLACIIILVTVYTETKALAKHDMEKELRALSKDVGHLRKAGKEQADVIRQLQKTVEIQSARITILRENLQNQQTVIRKNNYEIEKLKKVNSDLQESLMKETNQSKDVAEEITKIEYEGEATQNSGHDFRKDNEHEKTKTLPSENRIGQVKIKHSEFKLNPKPERERLYNNGPCIWNHAEERAALTRKYRLLSLGPTQPIPEETIAFYAYMSADMNGIGNHHSLVFDVVKTNEGNGFHGNTGVFIPPKSGFYVFSWTLRVWDGAHHSVELVINHDVVGSVYQIGTGNYARGGTTVVVFCNKGDDIYLRTRDQSNAGSITSNVSGRTSFTGWKI